MVDATPRCEEAEIAKDAIEISRRSAFALAWTKRTANRRVADALNATIDASVAYEMVNFLQLARLGHDPMSLEPENDANERKDT